MRIALVSYTCRDNDVAFNLSQIEKAMARVRGEADVLCFGEAYLQGFNCLCWDYAVDAGVALARDSAPIRRLRALTEEYGVALITGCIEREADSLYSSCIAIDGGRIVHDYRRISQGWKEYWHTDSHYKEGDRTETFRLRGREIMPALCGDMWDFPERFRTGHLLIWPVYVDFSVEEWEREEIASYARQAALAAEHVLMVNPIDPPHNHGGAFYFRGGQLESRLPFDQEGVLIVDIGDKVS